jgi:lipid-A-disaccharide synthase
MKPKTVMVIAGEASGDILAAELVKVLRQELTDTEAVPTWDYQPLRTSLEPRFFGAGGPHLDAAGVELAFDMTVHSVTGISEVLKNYFKFRRLFLRLYRLALEREPDAIVCVDFFGFNGRFAHHIKRNVRPRQDWFHDWNPRIIQYISPQVWASREGRAVQMAQDYDLVLSIFPFEKSWYARKVPSLRVEFVGHPLVDRYANSQKQAPMPHSAGSPLAVLLPGSRASELTRHLPVMLGALALMQIEIPALRSTMILPNERLLEVAKGAGLPQDVQIKIGGLPQVLQQADLAIASTGTVTMECAFFGVPTVALYKTSWTTFQIAKRIVTVKYLAMPNLLAGAQIVPEFIQDAATPANIARAALELLRGDSSRKRVKEKFAEIIGSLGGPGATRRASREIAKLVDPVNARRGASVT